MFFRLWFLGIIPSFTCYLHRYMRLQKQIHDNSIPADDEINGLLRGIDSSCPMDVYISPDISVPVLSGIRNPNIYLTEDPFSPSDLYYIILHEYIHWKRKDLLKKFLLYIFSCIFWWNPLAHVLRIILIRFLEFNCDRKLRSCISEEECIEYLTSLYHTLLFLNAKKQSDDLSHKLPDPCGSPPPLRQSNTAAKPSMILKRFQKICK